VITARDEAASIEATLRQALGQRYPGLQVIAVDDRSTDGTGEILDRLAAAEGAASAGTATGRPERLSVVHVRDLPSGWLGKCHACHVGALQARGAFLLFMDADVSLAAPDLLERILAVVCDRELDHLAIFPDLRPVGALQAGVVHAFEQGMLLAMRGWEMEADRSAGGAGIGAFNLVRRTKYDAVGGYERLRMEIADDFKLGLLLRRAGARQRIWSGLDLVRCPWHRGAFAVLRGLEKNLFAGAEYSLARLVLYTFVVLALQFGPLAVALAGHVGSAGAAPAAHTAALAAQTAAPAAQTATLAAEAAAFAWIPLAVQVASILTAAASGAWRLGRSPLLIAALQPISTLLMTGAFWNSALRTLAQGGVRWRDTFYPLAALKRGIVR
jgi:glycosyltransferase involved in cell wall biosynthesis